VSLASGRNVNDHQPDRTGADRLRDTWFAVLVFGLSFGCYLMLAGNVSWTEGGAGLVVATATGGFVLTRRLQQRRPLALKLPPNRMLVGTLVSLVTDTARVGLALLGSRSHGAASWQTFHPNGQNPSDTGRRALVTLLTSLAPNGFVLDLRPSALPEADHGLLLHRLVPAKPLSDADWPA